MKRKRPGECVYCGTIDVLTVDHIPPDCFFHKRPPDIVEVPSCRKCNNDASLDDEYFKTMMVMKDRAGNHPEASALHSSVFRGLHHPRKIGFTKAIIRSITRVQLRTPAGLHVGAAAAYNVDLKRLGRVVSRITKGLFWHHHQQRLPSNVEVIVYAEEGLRDLPPAATNDLRDIVGPVRQQPLHTIGNGVLKYQFLRASDVEFTTAWILDFYDDVRFLVATLPLAGKCE